MDQISTLPFIRHMITPVPINTLRPRQNGPHFPDDMFRCIFLNENVWIPIEISLKLVPKGSFNNNPAFFQIMAWRRPGDKPLSEPMLVSSLMHICVTRPQWVKWTWSIYVNEPPTKQRKAKLHAYSMGYTLSRPSLGCPYQYNPSPDITIRWENKNFAIIFRTILDRIQPAIIVTYPIDANEKRSLASIELNTFDCVRVLLSC